MFWMKNHSPTCALKGKTPYEGRYGKKLNLLGLVPFSTPAWVKIVNAGKLDTHTKAGYFIGFDDESTGYMIYVLEKQAVIIECKVAFNLHDSPRSNVMLPDNVQSEEECVKVI
jgi:hypothetical protein